MSKELTRNDLDFDVLEKLCDKHDLLLSDPLINLVEDVKDFITNKKGDKYEELCELIRGDSPNWTHEETKERLEEQVDALIEKENS